MPQGRPLLSSTGPLALWFPSLVTTVETVGAKRARRVKNGVEVNDSPGSIPAVIPHPKSQLLASGSLHTALLLSLSPPAIPPSLSHFFPPHFAPSLFR